MPQNNALALRFKNFLDRFPKMYNIFMVVSISCLSGFMFGLDISSMSAFIGTPHYSRYFHDPDATIQGIITSSMALGSFVGSILSTFTSESLGRRASMFMSASLWIIGAAVQASVQNVTQLCIGRVIAGFGVGFGSSIAPVYGSELAARKIRGLIGGIFQLSVAIGILVMFFVCFGFQQIDGTASFRIAWGVQMLPGFALLIGLLFIPESPRWLAKHGFWDEAEVIVANIQAKGDRENPEVMIEISEIKEQILIDEASKKFSYLDLFTKKFFFRTTTAVFAQVWQQFTGNNVMMYYIVYIFEMAGYEGNANLVASSIQYVLFVAATIPALYYLDKIGRRPVLLVGAIMMMAWQFAVGGILATYAEPIDGLSGDATVTIKIPATNKSAAYGVIACCYLFVMTFAATWGVGIWLYVSEVSGSNIARAHITSMATAGNWAANFALANFTPSAFKNISWRSYFIFGCFCGVMAIHVYLAFPETKGKRLEEMAQIWDEHIPAWKSASYVPHIPVVMDSDEKEKPEVEHIESHSTV